MLTLEEERKGIRTFFVPFFFFTISLCLKLAQNKYLKIIIHNECRVLIMMISLNLETIKTKELGLTPGD